MNSLLVCIGLFSIGSSLHLSRTFWFADDRERARESSMGDLLRLLAYQTQLAAVLLVMTFVMGPFALLAAAIIVFALAEASWRHSIQERRTLAWIFATAASQRVAITEALSAFYAGGNAGSPTKGARLISLLSLGMPLHLALQGAGIRLTPGLRLATAQGVTLGALPERLTRAIAHEEELDEDLQRVHQKVGYTATLLFTLSVVTFGATFLMIAIVPTLERMLSDFELEFPPVADSVIRFGREAVSNNLTTFGIVLLLSIAPVLAILFTMHQFGFRIWDYPLVARFVPAFDRARLYRSLAISFRQNESMLPVFDQLSLFFPRTYLRNRLRRARNRFVNGEDWLAALAAERLAPSLDCRMLESARKHGSIAWSLDELAAIGVQRQIQRLDLLMTVANWLLVLFIGGLVFLYSGLVHLSLTRMIEGVLR